MPVANTEPIFTATPNVSGATVVSANTTKDLTSGTIYTIWTAGANGGFLQKCRVRPAGSNVATVLRFWLNNGSATGTAANNFLYSEITVAATTNSETSAISGTEEPFNIALPNGWVLYVTTGTTVTAIVVTAIGGNY